MVIDGRGPPPGIKWAGRTSSSQAAPASELLSQASAWVSYTLLHCYRPGFHSSILWAPKGGRLMKHGEGITLTLTGRCLVLCLVTINNMAASGAFALEKEVHSESYVLTASCRGLTTTFSWSPVFVRVRSVAFLCDFASSWPRLVEVLPGEDSCAPRLVSAEFYVLLFCDVSRRVVRSLHYHLFSNLYTLLSGSLNGTCCVLL